MRKSRLFKWRPGLRFILTTLCLFGMAGAGGIISYQSLRTLYETSIRDAWTILFLDLEVQSASLTEQIFAQVEISNRTPPVAVFQIVDGMKIRWKEGRWDYIDSLDKFGIDAGVLKDSSVKHLITEISGELLSISKERVGSSDDLIVRLISIGDLARTFKLSEEDTVIYIVNRSGRLLFSNSNFLSPERVAIRPLVTAFIKAPFRQGQLEFQVGQESFYGFHHEIDRTNLVLFAEKSKRKVLQSVYGTASRVGQYSLLVLVVALLLLQIPLSFVTQPIRELAAMASALSEGNFSVKELKPGFGELGVLTASFSSMALSLSARDQSIRELNQSNLEKMRIEQDLNLARTIQAKFLFQAKESNNAKFRIASSYIPASQVAGDWYGVYYDEGRNETTVAIVDITGHGVGSAMMTPVISVIFYEEMKNETDSFDIERFLRRCNSALFQYGAGTCTGTAIVAKIQGVANSVVYINAGHPTPILIHQSPLSRKSVNKSRIGNLIGIEESPAFSKNEIQIQVGDIFILYSDGLLAQGISGRPETRLLRKDIVALLTKDRPGTPENAIRRIEALWNSKPKDRLTEDDMCMVIGMAT